MPSMFEQAVADAEALLGAARKSAEADILEKYNDEVKHVLNTLLEQEEDELGLGDMGIDMGPDMGAAETGMDDVPMAATDGENLCPCPDDEEEIEIDFAELEKQMAAEEEPESHEDVGLDLGLDMADDEEIELNEEAIKALLEGDNVEESQEEVNEGEGCGYKRDDEVEELEEGEAVPTQQKKVRDSINDVSLSENDIKEALTEAITLSSKRTGAKIEKVLTENKKLQNKFTTVLKENKKVKTENEKFRALITEMSTKMKEVNLSNAQLHYTNRVLKSDSLNERQKQAIVEALSKAGSIDEAKVIFEALESSVGNSSSGKKNPKSLREAVTRNSTISTIARRKPTKKNNAFEFDRMQKLAGIQKK